MFDQRVKQQTIFNFILIRELADGTRFVVAKPDDTVYAIVGKLNRAVRMPKHGRGADQLFSYLHERYGLPERRPVTQEIYDLMRLYAFKHGDIVDARRFATWDGLLQVAYLSRYDGTVWALDGGRPRVEPNGQEDLFFIDDDGGVPIEPDIGPHGMLFELLTDLSWSESAPGGITADVQRDAFIVWMMSLAFPDIMPTKPLLLLEGTQGSGKSAALQMLQLAIMGHKKPLILSKNRENDFGTMLLRSPIAYFDNVDSFIDWLPDAVCAYATTGMWTQRRLYTDSDEATIRPHSFIAVASKNPASFRREDTADRCVVLRLARRKDFIRQAERESQVNVMRPKIFGEYLFYVNRMVQAIRDGILDEARKFSYRMADFAMMAHVVGAALDWEGGRVEEMLAGLQAERDAFASEGDPLFELLDKWLDYKPRAQRYSNVGRPMTVTSLWSELETIATMHNIVFYKAQSVLAQKIRSSHLERKFVVENGPVMDGQPSYRIYRHTDPRLSIVPISAYSVSGDDDE